MKKIILLILLAISVTSVTKANAKHITPKRATLLINPVNSKILYQENHNLPRYPASLTKIMTAYIIFEQLQKGNATLDQKIKISKNAAKQHPSKMYFQHNEIVRLKDLVRSIIIKSANDAAVAAAEFIAGSEEEFTKLMNKKAQKIGMKNTIFKNASGLHHPEQITTAADMAILAIRIQTDFPEYYHFFSDTHFVLKGSSYAGHNVVTDVYSDVIDGIKTGFTKASGYNIIAHAQKGSQRLIAVVIGRQSLKERDLDTILLIKQGLGEQRQKYNYPMPPSLVKHKYKLSTKHHTKKI